MVKYISPQDLKDLIKSKSNDYLVVDVRDEDYRGGNIKGGINIPSEQFLPKLHQLIDDTQQKSKIIFHCTYSQQRSVYLPPPSYPKVHRRPRKRSKGRTGQHFTTDITDTRSLLSRYTPRQDCCKKESPIPTTKCTSWKAGFQISSSCSG